MRLAIALLFCAVACVAAESPCTSHCGTMVLDIHLRLTTPVFNAAVAANQWITANGAPHNGINLQTTSNPHISLYLTEFQAGTTQSVLEEVTTLTRAWQQACVVPMTGNISVPGTFAMWQVMNPHCLQLLSNTVVNATVQYVVPDQPIPGWLKYLPEPERSEKEAMIKKYGSPNVFSQFQPHVTLAWDDDSSDNLQKVCSKLPQSILQPRTFTAAELAVSIVGPHGTVPKDEILAVFPLSQ